MFLVQDVCLCVGGLLRFCTCLGVRGVYQEMWFMGLGGLWWIVELGGRRWFCACPIGVSWDYV